jgi:long-chain acyl-CoA synthetase
MNLAVEFGDTARRFAAKPALFWGDDQFTYATLAEQTRNVAHLLRNQLRVQPGDRVGVWLKNRPEFIPALLGALLADAVVVPINNFLKPDEVEFILGDAGIDVLLTEQSAAESLGILQGRRPGLRAWLVEDLAQLPPPPAAAAPQRRADDLAILIYTSGTTGHPKGAMLSHANLLHNVNSSRAALGTLAADRYTLLLPMFHSFMLTVCILLPLLSGGSIVLIKCLHPVKNIILEMIQHQATVLPAVPPIFRTLAHGSIPAGLPLRLAISGGAALPGEILREFTAKFSFPLLEGYGLSEASPVVSFTPLNGPWKSGSIGRPIPEVEMSVQDDDGRPLPDQATGEICVRGRNVMLGYWNQPEATRQTIRQDWLLTGDIGHRDADGFYYITDRKKDMLIVNGINVYPRQIEEIIYQFPGIKEAAVIGRVDARRGEQPVAYLVPMDGVSLDLRALQAFLRERLADYKVPRRLIVLSALPRNATGKILKTALRSRTDAETSETRA